MGDMIPHIDYTYRGYDKTRSDGRAASTADDGKKPLDGSLRGRMVTNRNTPIGERLSEIALTSPAWFQEAVCASVGGDMWFPEPGQNYFLHEAQRICRSCPVQVECLEWALAEGEKFGVYGGLTAKQREELLKQRNGGAA